MQHPTKLKGVIPQTLNMDLTYWPCSFHWISIRWAFDFQGAYGVKHGKQNSSTFPTGAIAPSPPSSSQLPRCHRAPQKNTKIQAECAWPMSHAAHISGWHWNGCCDMSSRDIICPNRKGTRLISLFFETRLTSHHVFLNVLVCKFHIQTLTYPT